MGNIFECWVNSVTEHVDLKDKEYHVAIIGLDNAGKSTLMRNICTQKKESESTIMGMSVDAVRVADTSLILWDMQGQTSNRNMWKLYRKSMSGCIFVVDVNDSKRIDMALVELKNYLNELERDDFCVQVFLNKSETSDKATLKRLQSLFCPKETMLKNVKYLNVAPSCFLDKDSHVGPLNKFVSQLKS